MTDLSSATPSESPITLNVKTIESHTHTVSVRVSETVLQLKERLADMLQPWRTGIRSTWLPGQPKYLRVSNKMHQGQGQAQRQALDHIDRTLGTLRSASLAWTTTWTLKISYRHLLGLFPWIWSLMVLLS
ncbi:hypothetical protein B0O80DRAFT_126964 [Mortierella sp. GBAus27b]|nr:hypothetical protein B0O80DRAFT_126964 [Mortierella sp. GBAus27b]